MKGELVEGIRTKQVEIVEVVNDKFKRYEKIEYFKKKGRKFVKIFQKNLRQSILLLSAGAKATLLHILTVTNKENIFYTIDLKELSNLFKYLKELSEKDIIVKVDSGKYMLSPYVGAIGYDSNIDILLQKRYNILSKQDHKLIEKQG